MYYTIDKSRLLVLHKHPSFVVVAALAELEIPDAAYAVTQLDCERRLYTCTEMELAGLYRNLTGAEPTHSGNQLRKLILELATRLPETEVRFLELEKQCEYATAHPTDGPYRYVFMASRPQRVPELAPGLTTTASGEPAAVLASFVVPKAAPPAQVLSAAMREPAEPQAAPRAPRQPSTTPKGGVRQVIWDTADAMWQAAGQPTDKPAVLALRKSIMDVLETEHGVKRTSSSNELGNWQKARITA